MFKIKVVQADFGDCLILEFGAVANQRYILVDGGPDTVFDRFLHPELQKIAEREAN